MTTRANQYEIAGVVVPPPEAVHVRTPFIRRLEDGNLYRVLEPGLGPDKGLLPLRESALEGPDFLTWEIPVPYEWGTVLLVASDGLVKELSENQYSSGPLRQFLQRLRARGASSDELPSPGVAQDSGQPFRVWKGDYARLEKEWIGLAAAVGDSVSRELRRKRISCFAFHEGHELLRAIEMTSLLLNGQSHDLSRQFAAWTELILANTDGDDTEKAWLQTKMTIAKSWHKVEFPGLDPYAVLQESGLFDAIIIPDGKWDISHEPKLGEMIGKQNRIRQERERKTRTARRRFQRGFQAQLLELIGKVGAFFRILPLKPVEP